MASLATSVNGIELANPFLIGSGPPGTNAQVVGKALEEGWGGVVIKTLSLDSSKVINVAPRYARLRSDDGEVIGWENIELISDRPFALWIDELHRLKDQYPQAVIIASIMEEYRQEAWAEIVERVQETGVAGLELNFSCPHGLTERKMGSAMGQDCGILEQVCGWVKAAAKVPFWAKLTPNVTSIADSAAAALAGGCDGVTAINTLLCVMGVNLTTLRPQPTVEGYSVAGGYSSTAIKPIAMRMVKDCAEVVRDRFPRCSVSAAGGAESGTDAAQFILLGADTVQVCTGVMKNGYGCITHMKEQLLDFMQRHGFETLADFRGHSLQYFTTHADLVHRQAAARDSAERAGDGQWNSEQVVRQSNALALD